MGIDFEDLRSTPVFLDDIYKNLPELLKSISELGTTPREKDLLLISSITSLSTIFHDISGIYFGKRTFPNLFTIITAPAASGKNSMQVGINLIGKINPSITDEIFKLPTEPTKQPKVDTLLISANITAAALIDTLNDSGGIGLLSSTETDTLLNSLKGQFGGFSGDLRKIYENESVGSVRKKNKERISIPNPKMALLLSGTPNQLFRLIPSSEDGLFSRVFYLAFAAEIKVRNAGDAKNTEETELGFQERVKAMYSSVKGKSFSFSFTKAQFKHLTKVMQVQLDDASKEHGNEIVQTIYRAGGMVFRIAMILTSIKNTDGVQPESQSWECRNEDYRIALKLVLVMLEHARLVFSNLPHNSKILTSGAYTLFEKLPTGEFNRGTARQIGIELSISERAVSNYLRLLLQSKLLSKAKQGMYKKK